MFRQTNTELHPAYGTEEFYSHPSVSVVFEFKCFWCVEWLTGGLWRIQLLMYQGCICQWDLNVCVGWGVYVCVCKCQNKETVQWIFHSSTLALASAASQYWPLKHAGMDSEAGKTHAHTHTHTCTHLFSQQAQLSTPRVSFAEVSCRSDHRANTPAVGIWSRAVHLPTLLWAWVHTLHTNGLGVKKKKVTAQIRHELTEETLMVLVQVVLFYVLSTGALVWFKTFWFSWLVTPALY